MLLQIASKRVAAIKLIGPRDALEEMIAAQMIACHDAAMFCYQLALNRSNLHGSVRREHMNQAGKLSRTFAMLLDALTRHRGKGQQRIVVEHVNIHPGGQAMVGIVEAPGGGVQPKSEDQAHAREIAHAPQPSLPSADKARDNMPVSSGRR